MNYLIIFLTIIGFIIFSAHKNSTTGEYSSYNPLSVPGIGQFTQDINYHKAVNLFYKHTTGHDMPDTLWNEIKNAVDTSSKMFGVPKLLIYSIMASESSFLPDAENDKTKGIMQVTPDTGSWMAKYYQHYAENYCKTHNCSSIMIGYNKDQPLKNSIYLGTAYLHWLIKTYGKYGIDKVIKHYHGKTKDHIYYDYLNVPYYNMVMDNFRKLCLYSTLVNY